MLPQLDAANPPLLEEFQRPGSLVIRTGPTDEFPLEVLLQFRPWPDGQVAAVELVLSMQTGLLDAAPLDIAKFSLPAGQLVPLARRATAIPTGVSGAFESQLAAENRVVIRRSEPTPACCLVAVHPGDLSWMSLADSNGCFEVECRLRAARLEKGVIRRMRLLFASCDGNGSPETALDHLQRVADQFEASALPLSA
jgi:hypothetical protein